MNFLRRFLPVLAFCFFPHIEVRSSGHSIFAISVKVSVQLSVLALQKICPESTPPLA